MIRDDLPVSNKFPECFEESNRETGWKSPVDDQEEAQARVRRLGAIK